MGPFIFITILVLSIFLFVGRRWGNFANGMTCVAVIAFWSIYGYYDGVSSGDVGKPLFFFGMVVGCVYFLLIYFVALLVLYFAKGRPKVD